MSRMPGATWRPLKENATQSKITPTQVIMHTAVDAPGKTNLPGYFDRLDINVESHFWIPFDGEIVQMMDTEVRADANRRANRRPDGTGAVSIETEDDGNISNPWSMAQLESIVKVIRWLNEEHGIPLVRCAGPDVPGIGYHAMWGAPSDWTPVRGKTCPGPIRIKQFDDELLLALKAPAMKGVAMVMISKPQADATVDSAYRAFLHREPEASGKTFWSSALQDGMTRENFLWSFLASASPEAATLRADIAANSRAVAGLQAAVAELSKDMKAVQAAKAGAVDEQALVDMVVARLVKRLSS